VVGSPEVLEDPFFALPGDDAAMSVVLPLGRVAFVRWLASALQAAQVEVLVCAEKAGAHHVVSTTPLAEDGQVKLCVALLFLAVRARLWPWSVLRLLAQDEAPLP